MNADKQSVSQKDQRASSPHPTCLDDDALLAHCNIRRGRTSGPGGQHRNKVETAVEITHRPTTTTGWASERRSQADNRRVAIFRLRLNLAIETRSTYKLGEPATELWQSRCRKGRIEVNPTHRDFPTLLAEALNVIHTLRFDLKAASTILNCTASQLVRFLKKEPRAIEQVNDRRKQMGLRVMK